jgi:hypothetical protein
MYIYSEFLFVMHVVVVINNFRVFWSRVASALCLFFLSYFIYVWNIITLLYKYIPIMYFLVFVCVCTPVYIYTLSTYFFLLLCTCFCLVYLEFLIVVFINFVFAVSLGGVCSTFSLVALRFPRSCRVNHCSLRYRLYTLLVRRWRE